MVDDLLFEVLPIDEERDTLRLVGELDLSRADALREALARTNGTGTVTLDLAELTYIDSTGLHVLMEHLGTGASPTIRLLNVSPTVRRVFEITALDAHPRLEIIGDHVG